MSLSKENKVIIDGMTYYGGLNQPNLKFVKVNVDCWEKIFDLLSLRDILAMSATCLRMRQIGGHYFRENFHGTECILPNDIDLNPYFVVTGSEESGKEAEVKREDFLRFADTLCLSEHRELERLQLLTSRNLLESLTTLCLYGLNLSEDEISGLANTSNNIETIMIFYCVIEDNFFGQFLASCPKMKCLQINQIYFRSSMAQNSVFQRVYPMLTEFQCSGCTESVPLFTSFLDQNPSIKGHRIDVDDLWKIQFHWTTIRLNYLDIDICALLRSTMAEFAKRIKAIHANGYFKTLRISERGNNFDWEMFVNEMASFSALEVLYIGGFNASICHLTQLKELHFRFINDDINLDAIAKNLTNLERLWIECAVDHLLPFLRHSKKLKVVILETENNPAKALNMSNLNEVCRMGGMKRKVKIGVHEDIYLATKWNTMNVDYSLVEITRTETVREQFVYMDLHEHF